MSSVTGVITSTIRRLLQSAWDLPDALEGHRPNKASGVLDPKRVVIVAQQVVVDGVGDRRAGWAPDRVRLHDLPGLHVLKDVPHPHPAYEARAEPARNHPIHGEPQALKDLSCEKDGRPQPP